MFSIIRCFMLLIFFWNIYKSWLTGAWNLKRILSCSLFGATLDHQGHADFVNLFHSSKADTMRSIKRQNKIWPRDINGLKFRKMTIFKFSLLDSLDWPGPANACMVHEKYSKESTFKGLKNKHNISNMCESVTVLCRLARHLLILTSKN